MPGCDTLTKTGTSGAMGGVGVCPRKPTYVTRRGLNVSGLWSREANHLTGKKGGQRRYYCTRHGNVLVIRGTLRAEDLTDLRAEIRRE